MSVLDEIVANTRAEVARRRSSIPQGTLERQCGAALPARDFEGALRPSPGTVRLIAEVKKASPSRGVLARDLDPVALAALVECHTAAELDQALSAGSRIVGINNRDLATFETRITTTLELLPLIPPGPIVISESGFFTGADVRRVVAAGAHAVLVGEGLVRAADVPAKL